MRLHAFVLLAIVPTFIAACGDSSNTSQSTSTSSSSASSSSSGETGGAGGAGGGVGGNAGNAGMGGAGGGGNALDPTYIVDLALPAPTAVPNNPDLTMYVDVAYGTDPQQKFDIILPKSAGPTPLMIQIHGGGFVGGDKAITINQTITNTLGQGIAYASLNYRLLQDIDKEGVIKPLTDCKRALQFLRYHATDLNLDATKVALKGGSAGAGTSLWIGTHDEMAGNLDAVDKQSTRILGLAANSTQASYDLQKWETVVFAEYGVNLMDTVNALGMQQRLASFYGMDSVDQFNTPPILEYRAEVDMLGHTTADDPPIYVHNPMPTTAAPKDQNELFHHGNHAKAVKAQATTAGIPTIAVIEAFGVDESNGQSDFDFLIALLKK